MKAHVGAYQIIKHLRSLNVYDYWNKMRASLVWCKTGMKSYDTIIIGDSMGGHCMLEIAAHCSRQY